MSRLTMQSRTCRPNLIAKYGYSPATAWLEPRYQIWRSPQHQQSNPQLTELLSLTRQSGAEIPLEAL
jgi:hypothetical protein